MFLLKYSSSNARALEKSEPCLCHWFHNEKERNGNSVSCEIQLTRVFASFHVLCGWLYHSIWKVFYDLIFGKGSQQVAPPPCLSRQIRHKEFPNPKMHFPHRTARSNICHWCRVNEKSSIMPRIQQRHDDMKRVSWVSISASSKK